MRCLEDVGAFHSQADQRIDIEEAPIPKFLVGGAPIGQSILLLVEDLVQRISGRYSTRPQLREIAVTAFGSSWQRRFSSP